MYATNLGYAYNSNFAPGQISTRVSISPRGEIQKDISNFSPGRIHFPSILQIYSANKNQFCY